MLIFKKLEKKIFFRSIKDQKFLHKYFHLLKYKI